MTPPDPATPSPLEALLREVDLRERLEAEATRRSGRGPIPSTAPRLAAIVRVLREALEAAEYLAEEGMSYTPEYFREKWDMDARLKAIQAAPGRADEIAEGIRGSVTPGSGQTGEAHETV